MDIYSILHVACSFLMALEITSWKSSVLQSSSSILHLFFIYLITLPQLPYYTTIMIFTSWGDKIGQLKQPQKLHLCPHSLIYTSKLFLASLDLRINWIKSFRITVFMSNSLTMWTKSGKPWKIWWRTVLLRSMSIIFLESDQKTYSK